MWCSVNIRFGLVDWNVQNTWGQYNHEPCTDLESTWLLKETAVKKRNTGGWTYHAFIPSGWGSRVRNPWALNHDNYHRSYQCVASDCALLALQELINDSWITDCLTVIQLLMLPGCRKWPDHQISPTATVQQSFTRVSRYNTDTTSYQHRVMTLSRIY